MPGGRFGGALVVWRLTKDSKGSRRACLISLSAGAAGPPAADVFSVFLAADFAGALATAGFFLAGFAAGEAGFAAGCATCAAGLLPAGAAGFAAGGVEGFAWACEPGAAAASKIPSPRVIAERIVRSFPLRVSQPRRLEAWLQLTEPHPCRRAW